MPNSENREYVVYSPEMAKSKHASHQTSFAAPFVVEKILQRLQVSRARMKYHLAGYLITHQVWLRRLFAMLRVMRPTFIMGDLAIVTRNKDVNLVLQRAVDFELGEFARKRMLAGSFVLEIDWPETHAVQQEEICKLLSGGSARIAGISRSSCSKILQTQTDTLDVADLARQATTAVVDRYYGLNPAAFAPGLLADWLSRLASAIILLPPEGTPERRSVEIAADQLRSHVRALIKATDSDASGQDSLLSEFVQHSRSSGAPDWMTRDWVESTICGLTIFGTATVVRTASDIIDEILRRPVVLASAQSAAKSAHSDAELLKQHIYEALRFRPMLPVLARYCAHGTVVGPGTFRRRVVKAGATVLAPPLAALHDPRTFPRPGVFRPDRDPKADLVFGAGPHACIGRSFAEAALIEIVGAVLRLPNLHRLRGRKGRIVYRGAAVSRLLVGFGD